MIYADRGRRSPKLILRALFFDMIQLGMNSSDRSPLISLIGFQILYSDPGTSIPHHLHLILGSETKTKLSYFPPPRLAVRLVLYK